MAIGSRFDNETFKRKRTGESTIMQPPDVTFKTRGFMNYIYFDNENFVISSNIKDEIEEKLISEVIYDDDFFELNETS
jgi:hypothetical protein